MCAPKVLGIFRGALCEDGKTNEVESAKIRQISRTSQRGYCVFIWILYVFYSAGCKLSQILSKFAVLLIKIMDYV